MTVSLRQLLACALLISSLSASADILRVDRNVVGGNADGSTWADAFPYLQDALDDARSGDEIWVAEGVHYPDEGANQTEDWERSLFEIRFGVSCYGGFAGDEALRNERNPDLHPTILSGDLAQDDLNDDANGIAESVADLRGLNALSVVFISNASSSTVFDGFTITAADRTRSSDRGGGMFVNSSSIVIARCRFSGNRCAGIGGALHLAGREPTLTNCIFIGNEGTSGGGAISFDSITSRCVLMNCLIAGNAAPAGFGGGLLLTRNSSPAFNSCTIAGNVAQSGGGLYLREFSRPQIHNTIIWGNEVTHSTTPGSASVRNRTASDFPTFTNSLVAQSTGLLPGPMGRVALPSPILDTDPGFLALPAGSVPLPGFFRLLSNSPAIDAGRDLALPRDEADLDQDGDRDEIIPIDLGGAPRRAGAQVDLGAFEGGAGPAITNPPAPLIIRPGTGPVIGAFDLSESFDNTAVAFALVAHSPSTIVEVDLDPATGSIDLTPQSNQLGRVELIVSADDAAGDSSFLQLVIDVFPAIFFVDDDAPDNGDGLSWGTAFKHLQDALRFGGGGYEIWIAGGLYHPDQGMEQSEDDHTASFHLPAVPIFGGFAGSETQRDQRDPALHLTILSGDLQQDDLNDDGNSVAESDRDMMGQNSYTVVQARTPGGLTTIDGLIITAGWGVLTDSTGGGLAVRGANLQADNCTFSGSRAHYGGAIHADQQAVVTFNNCQFTGNDNDRAGGGIYATNQSEITVNNCVFTGQTGVDGPAIAGATESQFTVSDSEFVDNQASNKGGAVDLDRCTLSMERCQFETNLARSGGAMTLVNTEGLVQECSFTNNSAALGGFPQGGAVTLGGLSPPFVDCTFLNNSAREGGALSVGSTCVLVNCVFAGNTASDNGGALSVDGELTCVNSIFAGNQARQGGAIYNTTSEGPIVNCVFNGNVSQWAGGALYNQTFNFNNPAAPAISNSVFWQNSARGVVDSIEATTWNSSPSALPSFENCLVGGSGGSAAWDTTLGTDQGNNLDLDPLFIAGVIPGSAPSTIFDLRPTFGSPLVDAGTNLTLPADELDLDGDGDLLESIPYDHAGATRVVGAAVDLGPYESTPGPAVVSAPAPQRLLPLSGDHADFLDLRPSFDASAVAFALAGTTPEGIVTAQIDPVSGLLGIQVQPDRIGRSYLAVAGINAAGDRTLLPVIIDVIPDGIRVDSTATGKGTGLTWADAFPSLQDALAIPPIPGIGYEYWVAAGVYYPDEGSGFVPDDEEARFELRGGARVYGGFAGTESQRSERDPSQHLSILSGDLTQDDIHADGSFFPMTAEQIQGQNAETLVTAVDDALPLLDGLVLTAAIGGALANGETGDVTARGCKFVGNHASVLSRGGAVTISHGNPQFDGCQFDHNSSRGVGAVYLTEAASQFVSSTFRENSSGAIFCALNSTLDCQDCVFTENTTGGDGGALNVLSSSTLTLIDCSFTENETTGGVFDDGGAINLDRSTLQMTGCDFVRNTTSGVGGALHITFSPAEVTAVNCRFQGNLASSGGGLAMNNGTSGSLANCLFTGNRARNRGGGVNSAFAPLTITNSTFSGNDAGTLGGAILTSATTTLDNCILWNNREKGATSTPGASASGSALATFSHCLVANSGGSANWNPLVGTDSGANIDLDPLFLIPLDPYLAPGAAGDFRVMPGSPITDVGDTSALPLDLLDLDGDSDLAEPLPLDLANAPRACGPSVDLGAFETKPGPAIVNPVPLLRLPPNSGSHAALVDLGDAFDPTATTFALDSRHPSDLVAVVVNPATGQIDVTPQPDRIGRTTIVVEAANAAGDSSYYSFAIDVLPAIVFVDQDATGAATGLSWSDAFPTLQDALALGSPDYEIWIASGVYYPDSGAGQVEDNPSATFRLPDRVRLFGGFSGSETLRSQRNPVSFPVVLSGDLAQDDLNADSDLIAETIADIQGSNADTVITAEGTDAATLIDGLTITAGNADDGPSETAHRDGGGLHLLNGDLTVQNCAFARNSASGRGGALFTQGAHSTTFRSCRFSGNFGSAEGGGARTADSTLVFEACEFTDNSSRFGGAIANESAHLDLVHCTLASNTSLGRGGGFYSDREGSAHLTGCVVLGNHSDDGGGLFTFSRDLKITNSVFTGNAAKRHGALSHSLVSPGDIVPEYTNCIVWNNQAGFLTSTADASSAGPARFTSCLVANSGGSAAWDLGPGAQDGGNNIDSDPRFVLASDPGTAPNQIGDLRLQIVSPAVDTGDTAALPADRADVDQDGDTAEQLPLDFAGNPRTLGGAVDLGPYETAAPAPVVVNPVAPLQFQPDSGLHPAAVDLGNVFDASATSFALDSVHPPSSLAANLDPVSGILDLEVQPDQFGIASVAVAATNGAGATSLYILSVEVFPEVVFVDDSATGLASGLSWADAFPSLQHALAKGGTGYEIWVAQGVYYPDEGSRQVEDDQSSTFRLLDGVDLYGGFAGDETLRSQRDWLRHPTILSGDIRQQDPNEDGNFIADTPQTTRFFAASTVVTGHDIGAATNFDGFVITAGTGGTAPTGLSGQGAGMSLHDSSPNISQCRFVGNVASSRGGGLALFDSAPLLTNCQFDNNRSFTSFGGAAVTVGLSSPTFLNCSFFANVASSGGALWVGFDSHADLINCTLTANRGRDGAGAIWNHATYSCTNCIIWNNSRLEGSLGVGNAGAVSSSTFSHCIVQGSGGSAAWLPATGTDLGDNLDADPLFLVPIDPPPVGVDPEPGLFLLDAGSPALDAGDNVAVSTTTDLSGRPRIVNGTVDLGAFEAHGDELDSDLDGLSDSFERSYTDPPSPTALDPFSDLDFDGLVALLEFAYGLNPNTPDADLIPPPALVEDQNQDYLTIFYRRNILATRFLHFSVERSTDLGLADDWSTGETTLLSTYAIDSATSLVRERSNSPLDAQPAEHLRLRVMRK